jgi:transcriptional regulator with XRE-family HTH domain
MRPENLARLLDGLTLRDIQSKTGLNPSTVNAIKRGRLRPSTEQWIRLISALPSYDRAVAMLKMAEAEKNE